MAQEAIIIREGRRLAERFHRVLDSMGWPRDSYQLLLTAKTNLPKWQVIILSDRVEDANELDLFDDIMDEVDRWCDSGEVDCPIGLSLWKPERYARFARFELKDGEIEIPDELANPGIEDRPGPSRAPAR